MNDATADRTVQEVYESLTDEQKMLVEYLVGEAAALEPRDLAGLIDDEDYEGIGIADNEGIGAELAAEAEAQTAAMRSELIDLINKLAVVRGKVTLSSGKEADYYIDLRRVTLHHRGAPLIGALMFGHLLDLGFVPVGLDDEDALEEGEQMFSAIGGLTLGADPIADAVVHAGSMIGAEVDAFVVRKAAKAHGMQRQIEGPDIAGRNVVIVEDTTTTGGSPIAAIEAVRAAGGYPVAVATIVDRDTGAREKIEELGVPYYPMFSLSDLTI